MSYLKLFHDYIDIRQHRQHRHYITIALDPSESHIDTLSVETMKPVCLFSIHIIIDIYTLKEDN